MEISGKMKIQIFHRNHLGKSAACGTALNTEARSQRWLTKCDHGLFSKSCKSVCQADACGSLSFSCRSRVDGSYQNQFSVRTVFYLLPQFIRDLCLVLAIQFQIILNNTITLCNLFDWKLYRLLRDFDICFHSQNPPFSCVVLG